MTSDLPVGAVFRLLTHFGGGTVLGVAAIRFAARREGEDGAVTDASDPNDATTGIGVPSDNTTLLSVLEDFRQEGWDGNLVLTEDGPIRCPSCRTENEPDRWEQGALRRMEGASDPADMMAVLGLTCPECATRGTVVLHYGPTASPAEAAALLAIEADPSADGEDPDVPTGTPPA